MWGGVGVSPAALPIKGEIKFYLKNCLALIPFLHKVQLRVNSFRSAKYAEKIFGLENLCLTDALRNANVDVHSPTWAKVKRFHKMGHTVYKGWC
jgi:hypothetical protein